jgi:glycosyltransferase involved in cell wall biosynthesis
VTRPPVLFLHASDEAYGADRVLLTMAHGLRERGRAVAVLLPDDTPRGWLSDRLGELGIAVTRGPLAPARRRYLRLRALPEYARSLLRARRFVRSRARSEGAGIVHVNTSALLVGAFVGRPARSRLVWHVHEIVVRPRVLAWIFRLAPVLYADRVVTVSEAVRRHVTPFRLLRHRVVRLHNGIERRTPRVRADLPVAGSPIVAFVGRLNRWKGYEVFVDAAAEVARRFPDAAFVVAGDPPQGEEWRASDLADRLSRHGLEQRVTVLGFYPDPPALFDGVDIVAAPSTWPDPFPLVILEAMRAGCAVVASGHGGAPEMIEHGRSGLLVPPGDASALAEAIGSLVGDPPLRSRLGAAARERVATEFTNERFLDGLERIYESLGR